MCLSFASQCDLEVLSECVTSITKREAFSCRLVHKIRLMHSIAKTERERGRQSPCVCKRSNFCTCLCVNVCAFACVHAYISACVRILFYAMCLLYICFSVRVCIFCSCWSVFSLQKESRDRAQN